MRFTVRRPPTGEVSPCCHRPSGGDVACSVDVGVAPASSAGFALEDRLALTVPGSDVPAHRASLRRIRGRDLLDPTVSLLLQTRSEQAPAAAVDGAVQPALLSNANTGLLEGSPRRAGQRTHVECFDPDRVEAPRNVSSAFLDPVLAAVGLTSSQFRECTLCSPAPVGAAFGASKSLLQHLQAVRLARGQARCVQHFPGRQRRRDGNATVDAHYAAIARPADRRGDVGEGDMPAAGSITRNPVGLDTLGHRPRQPKPHPSHLGHPHPTEAAIQSHNVVRFHRDLPKPFVDTCLAPRRATVGSVVEVLPGLCEIPQRLLLHGLAPGTKPRVLSASLRQLRGLLSVAGSLAAGLPMLLLLNREIPHITCVPTVFQENLFLRRRGRQPTPRHIRKVSAATDIRLPYALRGAGQSRTANSRSWSWSGSASMSISVILSPTTRNRSTSVNPPSGGDDARWRAP